MNRRFASLLTLLMGAGPIVLSCAAERSTMSDNATRLGETLVQLKRFDGARDPEDLRIALLALQAVELSKESDPKARAKVRADALALWLDLLRTLDRHLDPGFDQNKLPNTTVSPPLLPGIGLLPGAVDPAAIQDPAARAAYLKAIADNNAYADHYRQQVELRRLDERVMASAEAYIRQSYSFAPADREEARAAIVLAITDPVRQSRLLKACFH